MGSQYMFSSWSDLSITKTLYCMQAPAAPHAQPWPVHEEYFNELPFFMEVVTRGGLTCTPG